MGTMVLLVSLLGGGLPKQQPGELQSMHLVRQLAKLKILLRYSACCTAWHSLAWHGTAQHSTAQHSTAQHSTAQHSTATLAQRGKL